MKSGKISTRQFALLVFTFTVGSSILLVPSLLAGEAKQDGWLAGIAGLIIGLLYVLLYSRLGKKYPTMTIVQYSEVVLGKWFGKIIAVLFFFFFFIISSSLLWDIGNFMTTQVLAGTPIQMVYITFTLVTIMGAKLGIEVLGRTAEIFFPWIMLFFLLIVVFTTPHIHFQKVQPVLENGITPVVRGAVLFSVIPFVQLSAFLMVIPSLKEIKKVNKSFLIGAAAGGSLLLIISTTALFVLGVDLTARNHFPSYMLAKKISIGGFLERIESFVAMMWFITIFFKLTICFYALSLILSQMLGINNYRVVTLPLGMLIIVFGLIIFPNEAYAGRFVMETWPFYALTFGFFLPLLLLVFKTGSDPSNRQKR
ncbi:GerAB/ArcD/ProY family transporter [Bacillus taeanensis]|uniref:GerAB/ArcD/ProY family transporter n=1 Tax=Bacillus taeanensis TaxID=273032 RepID=UPI0015F0A988|nr:endospore germination permease [Bacillus taeanensis]